MNTPKTGWSEMPPYQTAVARLGELALDTTAVQSLLESAVNLISETLGSDLAEVLEHSPDQATFTFRTSKGWNDDLVSSLVPAGTGSHAGFALCSNSAVVVADLVAESRFADPLLLACGAVSGVAVPIRGRHRPFGALAVHSRRARVFAIGEVHFLETAASILATALARHQAEEIAAKRERQIQAVFDSSLDALLVADDDGRYVDANPAACALLGMPREELVGTSIMESLLPEEQAEGRAAWQALLCQCKRAADVELRVPGQARRILEYAVVAGILPERNLLVFRDVTERRQLHTRLALADRLVSVGTLAAGLAHELNNPLSYVAANISFLGEALGDLATSHDPDRARELARELGESVQEARDGAERMRTIIRDLRSFSHPEESKIGPLDVRPILESCVHIAWNEIRHRAQLVKELDPVPCVLACEARLGQVFLNLILNAVKAIPEGDAANKEIRLVSRTLADGRAAVEIRDTGCGIAPDDLGHLFDPFYTTRPIGEGIGLGLSMCHGIVAALGGEMEVESEVGQGSIFRVILPPADLVEEAAAAHSGEIAGAGRRARILVVDDELFVGTSIRRALGRDHEVTVVSSARQALDLVRGGAAFDLLLSDLLMPEMNGMELYRELGQMAPELAERMLFLTGGAFTPAARSFLEQERVVCLEKPFELSALREAVRRRMAETAIM